MNQLLAACTQGGFWHHNCRLHRVGGSAGAGWLCLWGNLKFIAVLLRGAMSVIINVICCATSGLYEIRSITDASCFMSVSHAVSEQLGANAVDIDRALMCETVEVISRFAFGSDTGAIA